MAANVPYQVDYVPRTAAERAEELARFDLHYPNASKKWRNNPVRVLACTKELESATHVSVEQRDFVRSVHNSVLSSLCSICGNADVLSRFVVCEGGGCLACEMCTDPDSRVVFCGKGRKANPHKCGICDQNLLPKPVPLPALDNLNKTVECLSDEALRVTLQDNAINESKIRETEHKINTFKKQAIEKQQENVFLKDEIEDLKEALALAQARAAMGSNGPSPSSATGADSEDMDVEEREEKEEKKARDAAIRQKRKADLEEFPFLSAKMQATEELFQSRGGVLSLETWKNRMQQVELEVQQVIEEEVALRKQAAKEKAAATRAANKERARRAEERDE